MNIHILKTPSLPNIYLCHLLKVVLVSLLCSFSNLAYAQDEQDPADALIELSVEIATELNEIIVHGIEGTEFIGTDTYFERVLLPHYCEARDAEPVPSISSLEEYEELAGSISLARFRSRLGGDEMDELLQLSESILQSPVVRQGGRLALPRSPAVERLVNVLAMMEEIDGRYGDYGNWIFVAYNATRDDNHNMVVRDKSYEEYDLLENRSKKRIPFTAFISIAINVAPLLSVADDTKEQISPEEFIAWTHSLVVYGAIMAEVYFAVLEVVAELEGMGKQITRDRAETLVALTDGVMTMPGLTSLVRTFLALTTARLAGSQGIAYRMGIELEAKRSEQRIAVSYCMWRTNTLQTAEQFIIGLPRLVDSHGLEVARHPLVEFKSKKQTVSQRMDELKLVQIMVNRLEVTPDDSIAAQLQQNRELLKMFAKQYAPAC